MDDEPQIVRAIAINLRARGYAVRTAGTGTEALTVAADQGPELVVLDLGLPDMEGTAVITSLRGWTSVPILVLSGRSDSSDKVEALDAGADDYVTKPFGMDELLAEVWGPGYETAQGSLRLYMGQLRRKLEPDPGRPRHLLNEPGMGYRFEP